MVSRKTSSISPCDDLGSSCKSALQFFSGYFHPLLNILVAYSQNVFKRLQTGVFCTICHRIMNFKIQCAPTLQLPDIHHGDVYHIKMFFIMPPLVWHCWNTSPQFSNVSQTVNQFWAVTFRLGNSFYWSFEFESLYLDNRWCERHKFVVFCKHLNISYKNMQ